MPEVNGKPLLGTVTTILRSGLALFKTLLFSRQWWWATLAVLLGMAVLARLGIWQLDRLAQRRARNAEIVHQLELPPLLLTDESLPEDLTGLRYRRGIASGEFDFSHQIGLMYQNRMNQPGSHLITPLVLSDGSAILVDRGWIPTKQAAPETWSEFNESNSATVVGFIQLSQSLPNVGENVDRAIPIEPQLEWYRVDIEAIQTQMPYELLPIYILQSPTDDHTDLPYRVEPEFDLSQGSHLSYAIQWFIFALILGVVYVRYASQKETARST